MGPIGCKLHSGVHEVELQPRKLRSSTILMRKADRVSTRTMRPEISGAMRFDPKPEIVELRVGRRHSKMVRGDACEAIESIGGSGPCLGALRVPRSGSTSTIVIWSIPGRFRMSRVTVSVFGPLCDKVLDRLRRLKRRRAVPGNGHGLILVAV